MDPETNKAFITRYLDAVGRDKGPATLEAFISDDVLKRHIAMYEASFPGYWLDAEDLIAEGDKVFLRAMFHGVHNGPLLDLPPTGREVAAPLFIVYRIANGKIAEHWMLADMPELMRQLSQTPSGAGAV